MRRISTCLPVLLISLLSYLPILGQCPGALECESAPAFCSINQLNGFVCSNPDFPNSLFPHANLCHGVGIPTNLNWWAFVGQGGPLTLTFNFDISSCNQQKGIQAGVFEGSCDGGQIWDCNADCNTTTFGLTGETTECEIYYIWVDGCEDDVCNYTMSVTGKGGFPSLPNPLPSFQPDPDYPCAGGSTEFCWPGLFTECDPVLEWLKDGVVFKTGPDCSGPVDFPGTDPVEICLRATIGNPNDPNSICDQDMICMTITPTVEIHTGSLRTICSRNTPFVWHGIPITQSCINPPCSVRTETANGCIVDSLVPFMIAPPELRIGALLEVPPSKQPFSWHGIPLFSSCINPPCSVRLEDNDGCLIDSVRQIKLLTLGKDTGQIHGVVAWDIDIDCDYHPGKPPLKDIQVMAVSASQTFQTLTDDNGRFSLIVPFDNYTVDVFDPITQQYGCPRAQVADVSSQDAIHELYFNIADSSCYDGRIRLLPLTGRDRMRCDRRRRSIVLEASNIGDDTLSMDTVVVTIDSLLKMDRAINAAFRVINDNEIWIIIPPLPPGQVKEVRIFFEPKCGIRDENKTTCFKAKYIQEYRCLGSLIASEYCGVILNSRDPNDLTITPFGVLSPRYIEKEETLSGLIRFHNSGSDTAYDVSISLELSPEHFDLRSVNLTGASAEKVFMHVTDSLVSFDLPDIRLPHNDVDTIGSHGFVRYSVKPQTSLADWTEVDQQAFIYFDHNAAIPTNRERQTIAGPYLYFDTTASVCQGDSFGMVLITTDTTVFDTVAKLGPDHIISTDITVIPGSFESRDTHLFQTDTFFSRLWSADTIWTQILMAQNGCDSLVAYNIDVSFKKHMVFELCQGDVIDGEILADTDTIIYFWTRVPTMDTLTIYELIVSDTFYRRIDTSVALGDSLFGLPMTKDTTFIFDWLSQKGCDSTEVYVVDVSTTKIATVKEETYVIYPNPLAQRSFTVLGPADDTLEIKMTNMLTGTRFTLTSNSAARIQLPRDLPSGIYIYTIRSDDGGTHSGKLVIL